MKKILIPAVLFAFFLVGSSMPTASAQGVHLQAGRLHVGVGNPHLYGVGYRHGPPPHVVRRHFWRGYYGGPRVWPGDCGYHPRRHIHRHARRLPYFPGYYGF